jgi:hypothetical protein
MRPLQPSGSAMLSRSRQSDRRGGGGSSMAATKAEGVFALLPSPHA